MKEIFVSAVQLDADRCYCFKEGCDGAPIIFSSLGGVAYELSRLREAGQQDMAINFRPSHDIEFSRSFSPNLLRHRQLSDEEADIFWKNFS